MLGENPFLEDGEAVIESRELINPDKKVKYNGQDVAIKDIPSASIRAFYGYGHFSVPGGVVMSNPSGEPWPYTPETCLRAHLTQWTWINDGQNLVCPGCGLDGT